MRARSRMAALALIVGTSIAAGPESSAQDRRPANPQTRTAKLNLVIAGLGRNGCDVEIKPGNASCKFRALNEKGEEQRQHITSSGMATLDLADIELRGADRTCSVAITVLEPGQPAKTIYRGFRLSSHPEGEGMTAAKKSAVPTFTCYLSSPSKLARGVTESKIRK